MEETAFNLSFLITVSLCLFTAVFLKNKCTSGRISCAKAKSVFSFVALIFGLLGGTVIFHSLTWLFKKLGYTISYGHGEILIASVVFNILLSIVFIWVGRVIIGWQKQIW
ncbi:hypothetical protein [Aliiglaciecola litoralis]|uniref:Uncharacterized protein n=1 Tax=Aliiglaciecola litoralis TaxID=582857 RepID=A0ABP3WQE2_9ALTE